MNYRSIFSFILLANLVVNGYSQLERIMIQADSGVMGSGYTVATDGGVRYAQVTSNFINANSPASAERVFTFTITFPDSGRYDLYARIKVGSLSDNDDSFFYGRGFGVKDHMNNDNRLIVNQLHIRGFTSSDDIITGEGYITTGVWKWINLYEFTGSGIPVTFDVDIKSLTQTFQVAGREVCITSYYL